jgi:flavin reductase (DIM6/NTAB) family NADH-FMN oxidoreductase RutF
MQIDPKGMEVPALYRLMISVVVPRPIAWTSTISPDGVLNAAPFSYFQALSSSPPSVMISVGRRRGGASKDTRSNIEATREFVVNIVSEESGVRMVRTSVDYPPEVSEFAEAGLTPLPSARVRPPRIAESAVSLECRLDRIVEVGSSAVCIGEVLLFHLRDDVLAPDGTVDPWKLRPLARLGGTSYAPLREVVEIAADGTSRTAAGELLDLWRDLRQATLSLARRLAPEQLAFQAGGGPPVGALLLQLAGATWDPRWTPERVHGELERAGREFEERARVFHPDARAMLRAAIRDEAVCQGQLTAALRGVL